MNVSVIIPACNSAPFIEACLKSLKEQTLTAHEIIVIDDASTDTTAIIAEQCGVKVFKLLENRGAAYARSFGASKASGEIVAFLDSDCVAPSDWLSAISREFAANPALGGVGGCYVHDRPWQPIALLAKLEEEYAHHHLAKNPFDSNPPGGNSAFRREVWIRQRSGCEAYLFRGINSGEDEFAFNEIRKHSSIKFLIDLKVFHQPLKSSGYFRRHINRGRSGALKKSLNLKADADDSLRTYGGYRLFFATVCLWLALPALISALFYPKALALIPICLTLFFTLAGEFIDFVAKTSHNFPAEQKISFLEKTQLLGLISVRSLCWVGGAIHFWSKRGILRLRKLTNIILSILHFWRPGRISKLFYFVTSYCNARCDFCFNLENVVNWKERKPAELTLAEVEKITRNLKRMPYLNISGGEPFIRQDLVEVVTAFYRNCNTQWVTIPTNASLTKTTLEMTQEILTRCPNLFLVIQISLDGMHDTHDQSRKIRGGFEAMTRTLEGLSVLRRWYPNLRIQIATCYDDFNVAQIDRMIHFCRDNFKYDQQIFYLVRETRKLITDSNNHLIPSFLKTLAENEAREWAQNRKGLWHRAVRALQNVTYTDIVNIKVKKSFIRPCHATRKFVTLYDDGQISPCEVLDTINLGNIRDHDYDYYRLIHQQSATEYYRNDIQKNQCNCDWMCATPINMLYDPKMIARVAKAFVSPEQIKA